MKYHFLRNKLDTYVLFSFLVLAFPSTFLIIRHIQILTIQSQLPCSVHPTCLSIAPFCYLEKPSQRGCNTKPQVLKAAIILVSCTTCLDNNMTFICKNSTTHDIKCSSTLLPEQTYSCTTCLFSTPIYHSR